MRGMKSVVLAVVVALAVAGAVACEADLNGAPCPCVEEYTCIENVCRPTIDSGHGPGTPDASMVPDSGFDADGGLVPDASVGFPDASVY